MSHKKSNYLRNAQFWTYSIPNQLPRPTEHLGSNKSANIPQAVEHIDPTLLKILLAFLLIRNLWAATTNASVVDVRQNLILHQTLKGISQNVKRINSDARMFPFKYQPHNYKKKIVFQLPVFATFTGEALVRLGDPDDGRPRSLFSRSFSVFSIFFGVVSCVCFCGRAETNTPIK